MRGTATVTGLTDPVRLHLHPGQAAVYRSRARFRVVVAGRRWGKTHDARTELIAKALNGAPGRYWYVAPDRQMAKDIFWQPLKDAIDPSWMAKPPMETELSITLINGAEISLRGAEDPDRLRGRGLRFVVLDEYADMKPETWEAVLRPQLSDYHAPALFIGTPKSFNHFYDLYQLGQQPDPEWASWQYRTVDNPFMDEAEIESARRNMDARTFRQEYEASFEAVSGRAYVGFNRTHHVQPVTLDPAFPVFVSFDFNISPAVAVLGQRVGEQAHVWREVFKKGLGGDATQVCAQEARGLLDRAGWRGRVRVYGDPAGKSGKTTGPSDHQMIRSIFPSAEWQVAHAQPHPRDRVAAVNSRLESMSGHRYVTIDPSCVHLIADLEQVTYNDRGELLKEAGSMLTHISDAFAYFVIREWPVVHRAPLASLKVPQSAASMSQTLLAMKAAKTERLRREMEAMRCS